MTGAVETRAVGADAIFVLAGPALAERGFGWALDWRALLIDARPDLAMLRGWRGLAFAALTGQLAAVGGHAAFVAADWDRASAALFGMEFDAAAALMGRLVETKLLMKRRVDVGPATGEGARYRTAWALTGPLAVAAADRGLCAEPVEPMGAAS